jgi:hypothetical protein
MYFDAGESISNVYIRPLPTVTMALPAMRKGWKYPSLPNTAGPTRVKTVVARIRGRTRIPLSAGNTPSMA